MSHGRLGHEYHAEEAARHDVYTKVAVVYK
jgi:hypothetical protein